MLIGRKSSKLTIKLDILPHNSSPGLVLLVKRDVDRLALDSPATRVLDEVLKGVVGEVQPRLQEGLVDALHALADDDSHADAHQLLEALDVGGEVGVEVVAVERGPELVVLCVVEEGVQDVELLDGLGQRVGGRVGLKDVRREEGEAEAEVGGGEDSQGLNEDIRRRFIPGQRRVELVSVGTKRRMSARCRNRNGAWIDTAKCIGRVCSKERGRRTHDQIELIIKQQSGVGDSSPGSLSGNRKRELKRHHHRMSMFHLDISFSLGRDTHNLRRARLA